MLTDVADKIGIQFFKKDMKDFMGRELVYYIKKPLDPEKLKKSVKKILKIFLMYFTRRKVRLEPGWGFRLHKKIIAKHEGKIDIVSKFRIGTTFTITIPKSHDFL